VKSLAKGRGYADIFPVAGLILGSREQDVDVKVDVVPKSVTRAIDCGEMRRERGRAGTLGYPTPISFVTAASTAILSKCSPAGANTRFNDSKPFRNRPPFGLLLFAASFNSLSAARSLSEATVLDEPQEVIVQAVAQDPAHLS
jgi:hypothetical protein